MHAPDQPPFPITNGKYMMDAEPIVRIGIVLEQDARRSIEFEVREANTTASIDGEQMTLPLGKYRIDRELESVVALRGDGLEKVGSVIRVTNNRDRAALDTGAGTYVRNIVAGRGFHWAKDIDQTLSHTLEFISAPTALVMINELPIETYLVGVITGEMSGECPIDFMKAQAIAARSWLLGQPRPPHPGQRFLWCNDDCCQRYQGTGGWTPRAVQAIKECFGETLITPMNKYCDARYSKSTGGISEEGEWVWREPIECLESAVDAPPGDPVHRFFPITEDNIEEYLLGDWLKETKAYASPTVVPEETITRYLGRVDEVGEYFRWTETRSQGQLVESLTKRGRILDLTEVLELIPGKRGKSGRLRALTVRYRATDGSEKNYVLDSEYRIREGLSMKFLYSGAFIIREKRNSGKLDFVTLHGAGWGHGAGLCQIGGLGRALCGQHYTEILAHYYHGTRLEKIY